MAMILDNYDLSHNNTMALSCTARHAMILDNADTLTDDLIYAQDFAKHHHLPCFILSFGSNVILPTTLNALVLLPRIQGKWVLDEDDDHILVKVACGENWHDFVSDCLGLGYYGLENLALIPGLVGACPVQNIGAYGVQVSDFIKNVVVFDLTDGTQKVFDNANCDFGYRHSLFKTHPNRYLISHVVFKLHKNPHQVHSNYGDLSQLAHQIAHQQGKKTPHPCDIFEAVVQIRQNKLPDPKHLANCGSFFQNPLIGMAQFVALKKQFHDLPHYAIDDDWVKVPAGWLIDQAGLKGKGVYPILTHSKQALVLTNHAPQIATQTDIQIAQDFLVAQIKHKFGITLVREPVWIC